MTARIRSPSNLLPFKRRSAHRGGHPVTTRRQFRSKSSPRRFAIYLLALSLAVFSGVFFWGGGPQGRALPLISDNITSTDTVSANFSRCGEGARITCVVDGDTFWFRGEKIRIADINTPELSEPGCAQEAQLGEKAAHRLTELLNQRPFVLEAGARNRDRYGRSLRTVTRGGRSLGGQLVAEGLAEPWRGRRSDWCVLLAAEGTEDPRKVR